MVPMVVKWSTKPTDHSARCMLLLWQFLLMTLRKNGNSCISNPADTSTMEDSKLCSIHIVAYLRHTRIVTTKHAPRLRNRRRSGVFSVPCREEPKRAEESRTNPAVNEFPGNTVNTLDVTWLWQQWRHALATRQQLKASLQHISSKGL
jgi:hypothetical protein